MTHGFEDSGMKLPGLLEEGDKGALLPEPRFAFWWELATAVPWAVLS